MTDEQQQETQEVEKAAVTLPPPGSNVRFTLLGSDHPVGDIISYDKSQQYGIFYEMYRQHPYVRAAIDKVASFAVKSGYHFVPEDPSSPPNEAAIRKLKRFFRNSNVVQLLRVSYKDLQIYGESFWLIERNLAKAPFRAMRLVPRYMRPRTTDGRLVGWLYGPSGPSERARKYDEKDVLHFVVDDPEDDLTGLSPLHSLQRTVAGDINAMEYNGNFFENAAMTGIVFSMNNSNGEEAKRNREYLETHYVGTRNAFRPVLLEGEVTVSPSVRSQKEMEFGEYRLQNRQEILSVLNVDPTKLGISDSANRSIASEAENTFHNETVASIQQVVEEEINNMLIARIMEIDDTLFRHSETDPRTEALHLKNYKEAEIGGIFNVNEIRAKLGLGKVDGGDVYFIQTSAGLIPLSMVTAVAENQLANGMINPQTGIGTDDNPPTTGDEEPQ